MKIKNLNKEKLFNKNIKLKLMATTSSLIVLATGMTGCSKSKAIPESIDNIVYSIEDDSCFDEVMALEKFDLNSIHEIEEDIKMAKMLKALEFGRVEIDENAYNNWEKIENKDILKLIASYSDNLKEKDDEKVSLIEQELSYAEAYINNKIYNSYDEVMELNLLAIKAKLLDVYGLDEESYDKVTIPSIRYSGEESFELINVDDDLIKVTGNASLEFYESIQSVYSAQDSIKKDISFLEMVSYNKDRIVFMENAINDAKNVLINDYTIEDKKLFDKKIKTLKK